MGMIARAEPLYRAVLDRCAGGAEGGRVFLRDAAYNLHLIYLHNGNAALARQVLHTYVKI
jgi:hypothetical protein